MHHRLPMKSQLIAVLFCAAALLPAYGQITTANDAFAEAGPHHVLLRPPTDSQRPDAARARSPVVELATGMNYWDGQSWQASEPLFTLTEDAFVAAKIQHRLRLNADINTQGAVGMSTPEGQLLYSTPVGIGLYDRASGKFALIGTITNSIGFLATYRQSSDIPKCLSWSLCGNLVFHRTRCFPPGCRVHRKI